MFVLGKDVGNFWSVYGVILYEGNEKKTSEVFVLAPFLSPDEQLLWHNPTFEDNHVLSIQALTNFRIIEYDYAKPNGKSVLLTGKHLPVLKNIKKGLWKSGKGTFISIPEFSEELGEIKRSIRKSVGDLLFDSEGQQDILLAGVKIQRE